jgi:hypothetical protein
MSKQKSDSVSIANILSILGIVLFGVLLYLALSLKGTLSLGVCILFSVGAMIVLALLSWFSIKAKRAENNFQAWRIIEISTVAVEAIFAIVVAWIFIMPFFYVLGNQDEYKGQAKADLEKCQEVVADFEQFETSSLQVTLSHMENAVKEAKSTGAYKWDSITNFMKNHNVTIDTNGLDNFSSDWSKKIERRANKWNDKIHESKAIIDAWSLMRLSSAVSNIRNLEEKMPKDLNNFSATAPFKTFEQNSNGMWLQEDDMNLYETSLKLTFADSIQEASGFSILGLVAIVIVLFLLLFNYMMAPRSKTLDVTGDDNGGGTVL